MLPPTLDGLSRLQADAALRQIRAPREDSIIVVIPQYVASHVVVDASKAR